MLVKESFLLLVGGDASDGQDTTSIQSSSGGAVNIDAGAVNIDAGADCGGERELVASSDMQCSLP